MERIKPQLVIIHGGTTFRRKADYLRYLRERSVSIEERIRWSDDFLTRELGRDFEIIRLRMPLKENAKYEEWKIHFERHIPLFRDGFVLLGNSLGGIFLAQYLSENRFPKRIAATFLVAPPFDDSLSDEDLAGGFRLKSDLSLLEENSHSLTLFFSKDDPVVPPIQAEKYRKRLEKAHIVLLDGKNGHFQISEFPEIIPLIRNALAKS